MKIFELLGEGIEDGFEFELDRDNQKVEVYSKTASSLEASAAKAEFWTPNENDPNTIEITFIRVMPKYRRQGLATAIWKFLKQQGYHLINPTDLTSDGRGLLASLKARNIASP